MITVRRYCGALRNQFESVPSALAKSEVATRPIPPVVVSRRGATPRRAIRRHVTGSADHTDTSSESRSHRITVSCSARVRPMPQLFLGATDSTRSPGIAACVSWRETPRYVGSAERRNESGEGAQTDGQAALKITSRISERIRPRARKTIRACPSPRPWRRSNRLRRVARVRVVGTMGQGTGGESTRWRATARGYVSSAIRIPYPPPFDASALVAESRGGRETRNTGSRPPLRTLERPGLDCPVRLGILAERLDRMRATPMKRRSTNGLVTRNPSVASGAIAG
jgi:hypothetical protein